MLCSIMLLRPKPKTNALTKLDSLYLDDGEQEGCQHGSVALVVRLRPEREN